MSNTKSVDSVILGYRNNHHNPSIIHKTDHAERIIAEISEIIGIHRRDFQIIEDINVNVIKAVSDVRERFNHEYCMIVELPVDSMYKDTSALLLTVKQTDHSYFPRHGTLRYEKH